VANVPNGPAGLYLLAYAQEQQGNQVDAVKHYNQALIQDPTLWCAYERLCKLQPSQVDPANLFKENHRAINCLNQYIINQDEQSPPTLVQKNNSAEMLPPQQQQPVPLRASKEN